MVRITYDPNDPIDVEFIEMMGESYFTMCDIFDDLEKSGCKAQTYAKWLRRITDNNIYDIVDAYKRLYPEMKYRYVDFEGPNIKPVIWHILGETEEEKMYYAKRVIEFIM
jgi:hypothetical protein